MYDITANEGWASVGIIHDTAAFAVKALRRWWLQMERLVYPTAYRLLITADDGSNSSRNRLWKVELQRLADELGLKISVCHFPPGTSKWNRIEHRIFWKITQNWRARPLVSYEVIVNLIAATTTTAGLTIKANLDDSIYPVDVKMTDALMDSLAIRRNGFLGDWNYALMLRT